MTAADDGLAARPEPARHPHGELVLLSCGHHALERRGLVVHPRLELRYDCPEGCGTWRAADARYVTA